MIPYEEWVKYSTEFLQKCTPIDVAAPTFDAPAAPGPHLAGPLRSLEQSWQACEYDRLTADEPTLAVYYAAAAQGISVAGGGRGCVSSLPMRPR